MVALMVRSPNRRKDDSVLLRILTNYFQISTLLVQLNLSYQAQSPISLMHSPSVIQAPKVF